MLCVFVCVSSGLVQDVCFRFDELRGAPWGPVTQAPESAPAAGQAPEDACPCGLGTRDMYDPNAGALARLGHLALAGFFRISWGILGCRLGNRLLFWGTRLLFAGHLACIFWIPGS